MTIAVMREFLISLGEYRPILSGLLGGIVALLLASWWNKYLPRRVNGRDIETLRLQYRWPVRLSNLSFLLGILGGLLMYRLGDYAPSDWRPLGLCVGIGGSLPLLILAFAAWRRHQPFSESLAAMASSQQMPVLLLLPALGLGPVALVLALAYW